MREINKPIVGMWLDLTMTRSMQACGMKWIDHAKIEVAPKTFLLRMIIVLRS